MIEKPEPKVFQVRCWDITLKCGTTASFSIREDKGDRFGVVPDELGESWYIWSVPREKREPKIRYSEIAGINYYIVEMKEANKYVPKAKQHPLKSRKRRGSGETVKTNETKDPVID